MDDDINNDPDLEEDSIDPFDSDQSEIDDSGPEDDPPVQRMVDLLLYEIFVKSTPFAKHFDMDKLFKILWRGRKQGRCGRTSLSLAWEIAHIYLVFAHAREI